MTTFETLLPGFELARGRTLGLLAAAEALPDPQAVLGWRPGPGRAHIAWQLMHIAITEELFATERLAPQKTAQWPDLLPRFRGGSVPDDDIPTAAHIREILDRSRRNLLATLAEIGEDQLEQIPEALRERKYTYRTVMHLLAWHEAHHQGQAHITLNLYKNRAA